jgi:hypothetical protein
MATLKELQLITERCESAAKELRQHIVTFANFEQEIERAKQTLVGLQGKIAQAEPLIAPRLSKTGKRSLTWPAAFFARTGLTALALRT